MRPDAAAADRAHAVRKAARAWSESGVIRGEALAIVERLHPDDRVRASTPMRVLFFAFAALASIAAFAFTIVNGIRTEAMLAGLCAVHAVILAGITEWQTGRLRRAGTGSEAATGLVGAGLACVALYLGIDSLHVGRYAEQAIYGACAAGVCAIAAWRWGFPLLGALSSLHVLIAAHATLRGRLGVVVVGAVISELCRRESLSERHPPSIRWAFTEGLVVGLVAVYVALNRRVMNLPYIAYMFDRGVAHSQGWIWAGTVGTTLIPPLTIALGLRLRDKRLLLLGVLFGAASLATLRFYFHIAPVWLVLAAGGAALIGCALLLRRWLDSGPGHERSGFTAEPLFESGRHRRLVEAAVTIAALTPSGEAATPKVAGGGGESGGGGASGGFSPPER